MLLELHLENFKSWQKLELKLGQVTGLFGTNSSGKSSILQFLLLLKQTKDATDRGLVLDLGGQNQLINLGSYKDLIYQHDDELSLKWSLDWNAESKLKEFCYTSVTVIVNNKEMKVNSLKYEFNKEYFFEISIENLAINQYEVEIDLPNPLENFENLLPPFNSSEFSDLISEVVKETPRLSENFSTLLSPIKTHLFPDKIKIKDDVRFIEFEYEKLIDKIHYLAPLREYPQREYQWSGASPSHVGYRGERTIEAILSATIRNETRIMPYSNEAKPFQEIIAYWLKYLGLIEAFYVKEIADGTGLYRAIVKINKQSPETFLTDVGFGVSQVLPALVLLYYVPEGSIILMEQPEIHLHPSVQSGLADVILYVAKQRNLQVIVESHSEHLLRRLQRRIAEAQYLVDELKLYFCHSENGASQLSDLKINHYGEIENWPANFFGDEMAEIAATRKAALKRKIQESANNA
ncbi:MAG: DUF3696 domain-containing protein [Methylococcaceae bacterium]